MKDKKIKSLYDEALEALSGEIAHYIKIQLQTERDAEKQMRRDAEDKEHRRRRALAWLDGKIELDLGEPADIPCTHLGRGEDLELWITKDAVYLSVEPPAGRPHLRGYKSKYLFTTMLLERPTEANPEPVGWLRCRIKDANTIAEGIISGAVKQRITDLQSLLRGPVVTRKQKDAVDNALTAVAIFM